MPQPVRVVPHRRRPVHRARRAARSAAARRGFLWIGERRARRSRRHSPRCRRSCSAGPARSCSTCTSATCSTTQLPSHYDYTSWYDLLVFRRLAAGQRCAAIDDDAGTRRRGAERARPRSTPARSASPSSTACCSPSIRPTARCATSSRSRLQNAAASTAPRRRSAARAADQPGRPDAAHGQPHGRQLPRAAPAADAAARPAAAGAVRPARRASADWRVLLDSRNALHLLEDTCEDQRAAMQEWIDALDEWPAEADAAGAARARAAARALARRARAHRARAGATCAASSRRPRPRCRCTSRRRATAPTTSCAR